MPSIIEQYIVKPIFTGQGYNPVNTTLYAIGFLLAIYLAKFVFNRANIEINKKWFDSIVFISFIGGMIRAIEDWVVEHYGILPTHILAVTPGIYFTLASIVLVVLWVGRDRFYELMKKTNERLILIIGFTILAILLTTGIHNILYVCLIVGLAIAVGYSVWWIMNRLGWANREDIWVIVGQSLDGFATMIALSMVPGYFEQHVVTNVLIKHFGVQVYPVVKITIAVLAIALIKVVSDEKDWPWILRLFIAIIGLGPGTRDTLRLLMGV